jgi:hypothetical protein
MPATGSDLDAGHMPLAGLLRVPQSPLAVAVAPLGCADEVDMVEVEEAWEDREVEELERCALLRGISILETSSALMVVRVLEAPLVAFQPLRRFGWKFGGGATAVMCRRGQGVDGRGKVVWW